MNRGSVSGIGDRPVRSGADRVVWIDAARGIGILLVVLGHALGGLIDSRLGTGLTLYRQAFFAIYTLHMPLFFVLAGLQVERRVAAGPGRFVRGLLPTVVWPYVLWSVIQLTVIALLGSLVNHALGDYTRSVMALAWRTTGQFWFLHALFLMHLIAALLLPRLGRSGLLALALLAKVAALLLPGPPALRIMLVNLVWYALGIWLGRGGLERRIVTLPAPVRSGLLPALAAGVIGLTLAGMAATDLARLASPDIANLAWRLPGVPAALAGAAAVIGLAAVASPVQGLLARLGRLTMPIFLMHVLFIAGTRIVLLRLGVALPGVILLAACIAGLAGPLVAQALVRSPSARRWLGFG